MPDERHNGLLTYRPPVAPPGYSYTPSPGGWDIEQASPGLDRSVAAWAQEQPIDAATLAVSPVPIVGDVAGVANDLRHYWNDPETRTLRNYALTGAGLLPFVPPAMPITRAAGHIANTRQKVDAAHDAGTYQEGASERDILAQLLRGNS
jgi:hypothetical protein